MPTRWCQQRARRLPCSPNPGLPPRRSRPCAVLPLSLFWRSTLRALLCRSLRTGLSQKSCRKTEAGKKKGFPGCKGRLSGGACCSQVALFALRRGTIWDMGIHGKIVALKTTPRPRVDCPTRSYPHPKTGRRTTGKLPAPESGPSRARALGQSQPCCNPTLTTNWWQNVVPATGKPLTCSSYVTRIGCIPSLCACSETVARLRI